MTQLIYRTEATTKKWKTEKKLKCKNGSVGKQSGESVESVVNKKRKRYGG